MIALRMVNGNPIHRYANRFHKIWISIQSRGRRPKTEAEGKQPKEYANNQWMGWIGSIKGVLDTPAGGVVLNWSGNPQAASLGGFWKIERTWLRKQNTSLVKYTPLK